MKILMVGAGGIGGYFGAQLIRAGADITFLLRPARKALIDASGLTIESPAETFTLPVPTVSAAELRPDYDLIVLAPKAYDLEDTLQSVANASSRGFMLPLLNGMDHMQVLDQRFGRERVLGGVAHIAAMITPGGSVKRMSDLHMLTVGPRDPAQETVARAFHALCERTPFDHAYSSNIEQSLWDKWVFLASLAAMTTLFHAAVGRIVATPFGHELNLQTYAECCEVAARCGFPIDEQVRAKASAQLTLPGSGFTASMLRDMAAGLRTEHEHILGGMIRRGQAQGLPCTLLKAAYTHIAVAQSS
jgi:2-dehydropantoate 2-reductase